MKQSVTASLPKIFIFHHRDKHLSTLNSQLRFPSDSNYRSWRNGFRVTSTRYSLRGPGFNSQHLPGGSQLSLTPAPRDLRPLQVPGKYIVHRHTCRQPRHIKKKKSNNRQPYVFTILDLHISHIFNQSLVCTKHIQTCSSYCYLNDKTQQLSYHIRYKK